MYAQFVTISYMLSMRRKITCLGDMSAQGTHISRVIWIAFAVYCRNLGSLFISWCLIQITNISPLPFNTAWILLLCCVITILRKHTYSNILKISPPKTEIFQIKNSDIFYISAQNIDCGYSLEPPWRGGSNEYPQSMFLSRNKKNNVYPCKPQFY